MMDDDPLEFEIDHKGVRQYFGLRGIFALLLPGFGLAIVFSYILGPALFGPHSWAPLILSAFLGIGTAYAAVCLGRRMAAESETSGLRYWIDAGDNLRVEEGLGLVTNLAIPLDRVGQVVVYQGPLMLWCGIRTLKVQTPAGFITLLGLRSPEKVRDILLEERRKALRDIQTERYS